MVNRVINLEKASFLNKGKYDDPFPECIDKETEYHLPKMVHFVWIISAISKQYLDLVNLFSQVNPAYEIYLWLDNNSDIEKIKQDNTNLVVKNVEEVQDQTFKSLQHRPFMIDYIRYLIVYKIGGIYSDIDTRAQKPLDDLFDEAFVSHIEEPYYNLTNGLFGFARGSNFLKYVLDCFIYFRKLGYPEYFVWSGPGFFTNCFMNYKDNNIRMIHQHITMHGVDAYTQHLSHANWLKDP
ncbi:MAG TPA: glycosyltransferase [Clostridia bacterium]|nr:glycosyltransferase [Clostridia bacterium]